MKRPALGHIFGYTALTIILTAGAAQSLAGSNTVASDDIIDGAVYSADIRDATVTSLDVKNNSLTGADITESTLVLTCPENLARWGDLCYTKGNNQAAKWFTALNTCAALNLRLPTPSEARNLTTGDNAAGLLWTDELYFSHIDGGTSSSVLVGYNTVDSQESIEATHPYRCVMTVGARP